MLAVIFWVADLDVLFNFAKLVALIALGFLFLTWFETAAWAVLIAAIIPWVDIWSVFFGPTEKVTEDHPSVFNDVAIEFAVPGSAEGARSGPRTSSSSPSSWQPPHASGSVSPGRGSG